MSSRALAPLGRIDEATKRLVETVSGLADEQVAGSTLIPPRTRGHVITHVARAADSLCRLLEGARTAVEIPQYASMHARDAEIEAGAERPVADLVSDVVSNSARLDTAARSLPEAAWGRRVRLRAGELRTPAGLMGTRLRELEVHHADLAAGYAFADIPDSVARWIVDDIHQTLSLRADTPGMRLEATDAGLAWDVGDGGPVVGGALADLLVRLSGRSPGGAGLSSSAEGGAMPEAPHWI
ncbi:maleylpyruvate isomerase family mycothiol-dependent enzyme [Streptomyces sp. NPDC048248]|uniref:maleylpyruvate isomerase family mycothiol-dependent enzyme n=1 Tax=Streptomyces sp. NPDC048248 TaxID=3365523 RepID=UPI003723BAEC